jgi:subtilisin family serine protease
MGINIINCSWGWYGTKYNYVLENIMKDSDILFVCAAGNKELNSPPSDFNPASFKLPNIISTTAINNYGEIDSNSNYGIWVDVAAPGLGIISTAY